MSNSFTPVPEHHDALRCCMRSLPLVFALILAGLLDACGGGGSGQSAAATSPSATGATTSSTAETRAPTQLLTGHYVGSVAIAGVAYFGDAVVTQDGAVRLYIGGSYAASVGGQNIVAGRPESSEQFVGTLQIRGGQWSGSGLIFGQECAIHPTNRFCGQPAPAEFTANASLVSGEAIKASLLGEIQVVTSDGTETWSLNMGLWSFYVGDAPIPLPSGQFTELIAEFASSSDVIVNLDSSGRLFFQSPGSGCVGNGTSTPHAAGPVGISDVTLLMESCTGAYAYLNGTYTGLALVSPSNIWQYDSLLQIWLSKGSADESPAAITMLDE